MAIATLVELQSVDSLEAVTSLAETRSGSTEARGRRRRNKAKSSHNKRHRGMVMSDFVELLV